MLALAAAPVPRGQPVTFSVMNASAATLECHAIAGHWYGFDLGRIAPGATLGVAVLHDQASGGVAIANARDLPVPIEFIYCGRVGDAWRSRAVLDLRAALATPPRDRHALTCRDDAASMVEGAGAAALTCR